MPQALSLPAPPELPPSPIVSGLLFENPWVIVVVLLALAILIYLWRHRAGNPRSLLKVSAVMIVLAGVLVLIAGTIKTSRERMVQASRSLIARVAAGDAPAIRSLLTPEARATATRFYPELDLEDVLTQVEGRFGVRGSEPIREFAIVEIGAAERAPGNGRVRLLVRVVPESTRFPLLSWWTLDLDREGEGAWRVRTVTLYSISGVGLAK